MSAHHFNGSKMANSLRQSCLTAERNAGDLQRNSMLWLSVLGGLAAKHSSFGFGSNNPRIEDLRLLEPAYLSAIGFLISAAVYPKLDEQALESAVHELLGRKARTIERNGYADDPLVASGLMLVADHLKSSELRRSIAQATNGIRIACPFTGLCIAVAAPELDMSVASEGNLIATLAAAVIGRRIERLQSKRVFSIIANPDVDREFIERISNSRFHASDDLETMGVLGALEILMAESRWLQPVAGLQAAHDPSEKSAMRGYSSATATAGEMQRASLVDDLRRDIAERRITVVVGAGVSIAATSGGNQPAVASWRGLLESGVSECVKIAGQSEAWANRVREELASGDLDDMVIASEKICRKLGAPSGKNYARWLRETLGSLRMLRDEVPTALRDLDIPLLSTNYDDILKEVTSFPPVTWRDPARIERIIGREEQGIVHLHGHWEQPETVILGMRTPEPEVLNELALSMRRAIGAAQSMLFVGFGRQLDASNIADVLRFPRDAIMASPHRHYQLLRQSDICRTTRPADDLILAVSYGQDYSDLAPFLRSLVIRTRPVSVSKPRVAQRGSILKTREEPKLADVRLMLDQALKSDTDLDSFCIDYFKKTVYDRFTNGMERGAKINLLLVHAEPNEIVSALRNCNNMQRE